MIVLVFFDSWERTFFYKKIIQSNCYKYFVNTSPMDLLQFKKHIGDFVSKFYTYFWTSKNIYIVWNNILMKWKIIMKEQFQ